MMVANRFKPWNGIIDVIQLERIRRDILNRISSNERQVKLLDNIIARYPLTTNCIARQKEYLIAVQLYRQDLQELNELIEQCKT